MTRLQLWIIGAMLAVGASSAAICAGHFIGLGYTRWGIGFAVGAALILLGTTTLETNES